MQKIVEIAYAEIGNEEVPKNSNVTKYGKWFGIQGVAWCGMFVSWCYNKAGFNLGKIGFTKGFAGCQTAYNHFKRTGEIVMKPQPGDIVLFDWNNDKRYDHTGIFVKDNEDNKTFTSIEGNTAIGNDSNGGEVMERKRSYNNAIFIHPKILDLK